MISNIKKQKLSDNYKILFIVFLVLGIYYPAISGGINSVDDIHIIDAYGINSHITLKNIFTPSRSYYYRPIIELSYYLDYRLWDLDASFMHLENILLHTLNSVLVFLVAKKVAEIAKIENSELPLVSALLFALHPVNTEPVSWIAGRTDPLATVFVLLSTYFLLTGLAKNKWIYVLISTLFLLIATVTKEVAILAFPAAFLIVIFYPTKDDPQSAHFRKLTLLSFILFSLFVFIMALFHTIYGSNYNSFSELVSGTVFDPVDTIMTSLMLFGFYIKKILLPLPLNFAIVEISRHYIWLGALSILSTTFFVVFRRNVYSTFIIAALIFISPGLAVGVKKIAWTIAAERYLYLPSSFFIIGIMGYFFINTKSTPWRTYCIVFILIASAYFTVDRNLVWHDNLSLYEDTIKKSPGFGAVRNELAVALIERGRFEEGINQLEIGKDLISNDDPRKMLIEINLMTVKLRQGSLDEAKQMVLQSIKDKESAYPGLLIFLNQVNDMIFFKSNDEKIKRQIALEIIDTNNHLYPKTKDPMSLYRNGQLSLFLGDDHKALEYFKKAYAEAPEGAFFKETAKKLIRKLE